MQDPTLPTPMISPWLRTIAMRRDVGPAAGLTMSIIFPEAYVIACNRAVSCAITHYDAQAMAGEISIYSRYTEQRYC